MIAGDYLLYALSDAGLFIADKETGRVHQYFYPGYGVSSAPTLDGNRLYLSPHPVPPRRDPTNLDHLAYTIVGLGIDGWLLSLLFR